ncbi:GNAT family N-acetyltransferase [Glutamicibacter sp. NPDC087344]|uniref:GNAT family N-acetyltransferase n=1 Tax=Glutamicibacter sp. NPDC087344 TaxID=3363994 RepID=UPI00380D591F
MSERIRLRPVTGPAEYPRLVEIWASAVQATHDFLTGADRERIQAVLASEYFPQVRLTVAQLDGVPVGFSGTAHGVLEMLFVQAEHRGAGIGGALLHHAIATQAVSAVDVNEQNTQALGFYLASGFEVASRSERDAQGLAYPLLHLRLPGVPETSQP